MRSRYALTSFIVIVIATLITVGSIRLIRQENEPRPVLTAQQNGYALGTPFMAHCQAAMRDKPMDWTHQQAFLDTHRVSVTANESRGAVWLDYWEQYGQRTLLVRYFAGAGDEYPCTFALIMAANHSEWAAEMYEFNRNGQPFTPAKDERCYSTIPPFVVPAGQRTVASLRCDFLDVSRKQ